MSKKMEQQFNSSKMMLPEHRCGLQEHAAQIRQAEKCRRPFIDEQLAEEYQQLLNEAFFYRRKLNIVILKPDGRHSVSGVPLRIDSAAGIIFLDAGLTPPLYVKAAEVILVSPA
ncbi:MAG TPA: hypothetical protein ENN91_03100 [Firmicutes bacterium]|nr:hypothetical protein [Bacillota bacterium]